MWRIQAMAANRRRRSSGVDDIAEAIHRMVDAVLPPVAMQPRLAIAPIRVPTVEDFLCHKPAEFTSKASPDEADAWLRKCEKIFKVMNCQDEQKLLFATYLLNDDAEYCGVGCSSRCKPGRKRSIGPTSGLVSWRNIFLTQSGRTRRQSFLHYSREI